MISNFLFKILKKKLLVRNEKLISSSITIVIKAKTFLYAYDNVIKLFDLFYNHKLDILVHIPGLKKTFKAEKHLALIGSPDLSRITNDFIKAKQSTYIVFFDDLKLNKNLIAINLLPLINKQTGILAPVFYKKDGQELQWIRQKEQFIDKYDNSFFKSLKETSVNIEKYNGLFLPSLNFILTTKDSFTKSGGLLDEQSFEQMIIDYVLRLNHLGLEVIRDPNFTVSVRDMAHIKQLFLSKSNIKRHYKVLSKNIWKNKIKEPSKETTLNISIAVTDYGENVTAGDYYTAKELSEEFRKLNWKVTFLSRLKGEWYDLSEETDVLINLLDEYNLDELPSYNKKILKVAWARNWFDKWCKSKSLYQYDIILASSETACKYIFENSGRKAHLFPIATNLNQFTNTDRTEEVDVCFTGSYWGYHRDIMDLDGSEILNDINFQVFGANWENTNYFKKRHFGFINYKKLSSLYKRSKLVVDDANHVTKPYGSVNSRVFDALACGALVITNGKQGSKEMFQGLLPSYESVDELEQLLKMFLENPQKRLQKVSELRKLIVKYHSYKHRALEFKKILTRHMLSHSIMINVPAPDRIEAKHWGDYHMAQSLRKELKKLGYRAEICTLGQWHSDPVLKYDTVIVLRGLSNYSCKNHQLNIMWLISHPKDVSQTELQEYDKVYVASSFWSSKLKVYLGKKIETMYQCTDTDLFYPKEKNRKREQSILFVGNTRRKFRAIINDLLPTDFKLSVYGLGWEKYIDKKYIRGNYIENNELQKYYSNCGLLLNDHWPDMRENGFVSNRVFDALACKTLVISDTVENTKLLSEFFLTYSNKSDLNEKIGNCLKDSSRIEKKIELGYREVINKHTYSCRAKRFHDFINSQKINRII